MARCDVGSDVLFEILSRVDLKTMRKCRILSRECNSLTYESSLMWLHCQRTKTIAGYFIQSLRNNRHHSTFLSIDNHPGLDHELSLDFLPGRSVEILAAVDQGLIFCMTQGPENRHFICKPSTKQWEIIPSPNPRYFTTKIAMVVLSSDPLRFKIIRLSDGEYKDSELDDYDYKRFQCEVFDSDIWAWKQIDDLMLSYDEFFNSKPAMSACGALHWLTSNREKNNILSFYEHTQSWELISLPDSFRHRHVNLAEYQGKLSLICVTADLNFVELWVVSDCYGEKLWIKNHTLNLKSFNKDIGYHSANSFYNADTLFMIGLFSAIFFNFKNGQFNRLELSLKHKYAQSAFFIQTDYEPIHFKRRTKISVFKTVAGSIFVVFWFFIFILFCLF